MKYYISIEKNKEAFEFYKPLWAARGVNGIMVETMSDGIRRAVEIENSKDDELFFIDIVADDIDFMPDLKRLSQETNAPILIATSQEHYTTKEHHEALNNGADFYAPYCGDPCGKPEDDIEGVLSAVNSANQRAGKRKIYKTQTFNDSSENTRKKIMAVDKDKTVHNKQTEAWEKIGVESLRVDTMNEAIEKIIKGGEFLFIAINEDTIPDFWEQLRLMRDVTDDQIYIITSSYEVAKHTKAVNYGADTYGAFADDPSGDVAAGLALLDLQNKRSGRKNPKTPVLAVGGVILSQSRQLVFVNDVKIELQKKEFDVLEYLMQNNGYTVSSEDILQIVWGHTVITEDASDLVRGTVSRIRQKFAVASDKEYIITEAKKGYKMLS